MRPTRPRSMARGMWWRPASLRTTRPAASATSRWSNFPGDAPVIVGCRRSPRVLLAAVNGTSRSAQSGHCLGHAARLTATRSCAPPGGNLGCAHHALRGELSEKAVDYLRQAGGKAAVGSALSDARIWFEQALGVLEGLPESPSTLEQGFEIRLALRPVLAQLDEVPRMLEHARGEDD